MRPIVTSLSELDERLEAITAGADDFLTIPAGRRRVRDAHRGSDPTGGRNQSIA